MQDSTPKINWILEEEKKEHEKTFFHYYVFFKCNSNHPVGLARFKFTPIDKPTTSFIKVQHWFLKNEAGKKVDGDVFVDPKFSREVHLKLEEMISEFTVRLDIRNMEMKAPFEIKNLNEARIHNIPWALIKKAKSYEDEVKSLNEVEQKSLKVMWREYHFKKLYVGQYENFRAIFRHKPDGLLLYRGLKDEEKLLRYTELNPEFIVLENAEKPLLIVFFIQGQGGNYFYDYLNLDDTIITSEKIVHELAKIKFYETQGAHYLHPLWDTLSIHDFHGVFKKFYHYDWAKSLL